MRARLLSRLVIVFVLGAVVGLPGLRGSSLRVAEAQPAVPGRPEPTVWTGLLERPNDGAEALDADSRTVSTQKTDDAQAIIVRFQPRVSSATQVSSHERSGALQADAVAIPDTVRVVVPAGQLTSALASYNAQPDVLYAEPDYIVSASFVPNDPSYSTQWALPKVSAPAAWDVTRGDSTVKVAILDCGIFSQATNRLAGDGQAGHPDLRGRVPVNQDFSSSSTGFDDYCDHGTHVAGIIAATGNNGVGVSGLAPEISLMNGKVLGDSGNGYTSTIASGIVWAAQNGAKVINMSLGRDGLCSLTEQVAINYAWGLGVVVVAAAGNSNLGFSGAPANCQNVISVAATTSTDARASFSNYGANVDVAAPGVSINSTVRTGSYAYFNGTSMATPYVAALAGLIWSQSPATTAQAVVDKIRTSSDQISGTGTYWAWGRINAAAALSSGSLPAVTATSTATATASATATRTPTPTSTATSPPTATLLPVSSQIPTATPPSAGCATPRPPVKVATALISANTVSVTGSAGAGAIHSIDFTQLTNSTVALGGVTGAATPFVYRPTSFANTYAFTLTRPDVGQPSMVRMTITDDCGAWRTFVGIGPGKHTMSGNLGSVQP